MPQRAFRHRRTRIAAAVLAAVLAAALALSVAAVAAQARHDCSGADCPVCALARAAVARFTLGCAAVCAALGLLLTPRRGAASLPGTADAASCFTPVGDKVRLNN